MLKAAVGLALLVGTALAGSEAPPAAKGAGPGPTREQAMVALRARVGEPERLSHALAVEAIMKAFARRAGGAPEEWGLAGLLHDIDLAETKSTPSQHGIVGARLLARLGFSEAVVRAVEAHDNNSGVPRKAPIDHALYCADQAYWVVRSSGLDLPSTEAAAATPASVLSGLARRGASGRIDVHLTDACGAIGLTIEDTLRLVLDAVRVAP